MHTAQLLTLTSALALFACQAAPTSEVTHVTPETDDGRAELVVLENVDLEGLAESFELQLDVVTAEVETSLVATLVVDDGGGGGAADEELMAFVDAMVGLPPSLKQSLGYDLAGRYPEVDARQQALLRELAAVLNAEETLPPRPRSTRRAVGWTFGYALQQALAAMEAARLAEEQRRHEEWKQSQPCQAACGSLEAARRDAQSRLHTHCPSYFPEPTAQVCNVATDRCETRRFTNDCHCTDASFAAFNRHCL